MNLRGKPRDAGNVTPHNERSWERGAQGGKKHRSADSLLSPMSKDSKRRDGSKIKKIGLPTASPPADRPIAALATK